MPLQALKRLKENLYQRPRKEQKIILFTLFIFLVLTWLYLLHLPLLSKRRDAQVKYQTLQAEITTAELQTQIFTTQEASLAAEYKKLQKEDAELDKELIKHGITKLDYLQTTAILKGLVEEEGNLSLVKLDSTIASKNLGIAGGHSLSQETINLEFMGTFFETLRFLKKLQTIRWPWHIDNLTYKVTTHPKAAISIKISTVTKTPDATASTPAPAPSTLPPINKPT